MQRTYRWPPSFYAKQDKVDKNINYIFFHEIPFSFPRYQTDDLVNLAQSAPK